MTGTGTFADPYIVNNWEELETAVALTAESSDWNITCCIQFNPNSSNKVIDMKKVYPNGCPQYSIGHTVLEGNGWEIRNLYLTNSLFVVNTNGSVSGFKFTNLTHNTTLPFICAYPGSGNSVSGTFYVEHNVFSGTVEASGTATTVNGFISGSYYDTSHHIYTTFHNNTFDLEVSGNGIFMLSNHIIRSNTDTPIAFNDIKINLKGSTFIHANHGLFGNCYKAIIRDNRINITLDTGTNFPISTECSRFTRNLILGSNSGKITEKVHNSRDVNVFNNEQLQFSYVSVNKSCTSQQLSDFEYLSNLGFITQSAKTSESIITQTLTDFESGNISSSGNTEDSTAVRTAEYITIDELPVCVDRITVVATDVNDNPLTADIMLYSSNTSTSPLVTFSNKISGSIVVNTNSVNQTKQYYRIVLKYSDGSQLTPDKIKSCVVSFKIGYWYIDENNQLTNIAFLKNEPVPIESTSSIYLGSNNISKIFLGSEPINVLYYNADKYIK